MQRDRQCGGGETGNREARARSIKERERRQETEQIRGGEGGARARALAAR